MSPFKIERSLSNKGIPYDNTVSEATNKILKTEFIYQKKSDTLEQLQLELVEYAYWYNKPEDSRFFRLYFASWIERIK